MGKPNTKVFDRMIRLAEANLRGARNGEVSSLSASEQARFFLHAGRGARRVIRGKSPSGPEKAIDAIFEAAEERYAAELTAAKKARQAVINEAASARVAKKSESRFW